MGTKLAIMLNNRYNLKLLVNTLLSTPFSYYDQTTGKDYHVSAAFQVYIQPDTYTVHVSETSETSVGSTTQSLLEWRATERTYIVHSLLIQLTSVE